MESPQRYFFRDLDHNENFDDGKSYHAAGLVLERYNKHCPSGKDLSVEYLDPFTREVVHCWKADNEIELFEVDETEYNSLKLFLANVDEFDS